MTSSTSTTSSTLRSPDELHPGPSKLQLDIPGRVVIKVLFIAAVFSVASRAVLELRGLLIQIAIAVFLAVAADPLVRRLQLRGLGRGRAVAMIMAGAFVAFALVVAVFVPPLVNQGDRFVEASPGLVQDVRDSSLIHDVDRRFDVVDKVSHKVEQLPSAVGSQLGSVVGAIAAGVFGALTIFILVVFLLLTGGQVMTGTVRLFPRIAERRWWSIVEGAYVGISAYVGGAIIIALCGGTSLAIVAFALGLPYALPLGLWMLLLEIIPMVGATIGAVPAVIVAFVAGGTVDGIVMVTFVIVYQQFENFFIQPRVQGRAASLSPLVVFVSVLVGSQLLGVLGALFAVPVAGVLQIFARQVIEEQGSAQIAVPEVEGATDPVRESEEDAGLLPPSGEDVDDPSDGD